LPAQDGMGTSAGCCLQLCADSAGIFERYSLTQSKPMTAATQVGTFWLNFVTVYRHWGLSEQTAAPHRAHLAGCLVCAPHNCCTFPAQTAHNWDIPTSICLVTFLLLGTPFPSLGTHWHRGPRTPTPPYHTHDITPPSYMQGSGQALGCSYAPPATPTSYWIPNSFRRHCRAASSVFFHALRWVLPADGGFALRHALAPLGSAAALWLGQTRAPKDTLSHTTPTHYP